MANKSPKKNIPNQYTLDMSMPENKCTECPDHPDLLLLRDAAADEREAIALYLEAAKNTSFTEIFLHIAEEEMHHYLMIMKHISILDPVQTAYLQKENLDMLTMGRVQAKWKHKYCVPVTEEAPLPSAQDIQAIHYLTKALISELQAINKYQRYMNKTLSDHNKHLFCLIMNEEKEHVAEFTAALFELTHEPLPIEMD